MEETSDNNKVKETPFFLHSPGNYCQEFVRAILKCLGLESEPRDSPSNVKRGDEMSGQGSYSSAEQPADAPSSTADPPAVAMARTPPRPPISGGRGPQTN
ncbi:hypothetical protein CDL12_23060 [Handroanthus impetiginosus]|uniref:Uncharacterized protein n=1 Tax=Handroanthus impetiginosus TaxID=429701 RepID=A0A2G9GGT8_9LAMI|nr:hypothetical protein CDL12_23060 [Handroanthus impetiginosus]